MGWQVRGGKRVLSNGVLYSYVLPDRAIVLMTGPGQLRTLVRTPVPDYSRSDIEELADCFLEECDGPR